MVIYDEKINREAIEKQANAIIDALMNDKIESSPMDNLIGEARGIVAAYDHGAALAARLDLLNRHNAPVYFNGLIERLGDVTRESIDDISADLDARLVKQAQSLDTMHDLFLHLSSYALAQDTRTLQAHVNLALRAQDQSARTIEKFKRLREKPPEHRGGMHKRTEQLANEPNKNAPLDR